MKYRIFFFSILLFAFTTCKNEKTSEAGLILKPDPTAMLAPDSLRYLLPVLDSVWYRDQLYRYNLNKGSSREQQKRNKEFKKVGALVRKLDRKNLEVVESIIQKYGWLGPREVGIRGMSALFLPIQHADLKTQEKYLPLIKQAAIDKKLAPSNYAMLADRVEIKNKRPQVYGTQINFNNGSPEILPLLNPDSVDKWRKDINMVETISEYVKRWNINWNAEVYKMQLPGLNVKYGIDGSD